MRRRALAPILLALLAGCDDEPAPAPPATASSKAATERLRTEPKLRPPAVVVKKRARRTAPGLVFLTPSKGRGQDGPMIVDERGELVWFARSRSGRYATDLRVQRYEGEPVLTYWEGRSAGGGGNGEYVIRDRRYREVARVQAARGHAGDLHEFQLTDDGTALFFVYRSERGIVENLIQEVDVETGELVFRWSARDHIPLRDSYKEREPGDTWDYAHLNSIDVDRDGHLLVSARNTHAIYKIHRRTGRILWTLGGRSSDFRMGRGTRFAWAHDARRQADGTITIFDNASAPRVRDESRGLVLRVRGRRVTLVRAYTHPRELSTHIQANFQRLPNGNAFLGWGATSFFSEHSRRGRLLFSARFADAENGSYRAYRFPWTGRPAARPKAAVRGGTVYASWNGATEVARWRVLAGESAGALEPIATGRRRGFETALSVDTDAPLVAVQAFDRDGDVLGTSKPQ